jgi:glycosyltransferase involved in cell wall biosynthesis
MTPTTASDNNNAPLVSVLMPVYNGEHYLRQAVDSILHQTFEDFEFIIINDGSTDNTLSILKDYTDPRIILLQNKQNKGLVATLNYGLSVVRGQYIARMDADDIAFPHRLEKQVQFMESNPSVGLLGTNVIFIDEHGKEGQLAHGTQWHFYPSTVRWRLLWETTVHHPSSMIRRTTLTKNNLWFDPAYFLAEDFDLWTRIIKYSEATYLPEVHLQYRLHSQGLSFSNREKQLAIHSQVVERGIKELMGDVAFDEAHLHMTLRLLLRTPEPSDRYRIAKSFVDSIYKRFVSQHDLSSDECQSVMEVVHRMRKRMLISASPYDPMAKFRLRLTHHSRRLLRPVSKIFRR